ncbi:MAG: response regulator transcription factor [Helicobacteraceae bacterium]|jgi:two-component system alkaline phosphatase synthesis response regulator PhoP|nr:response regulator transcription factor [Helicobacteraceae bacterium]
MSAKKGRLIFLVEDDDNIREMIAYALNSSGFRTEGFGDTAALFNALGKTTPALILLDIMLPGEDGISALRRLKQSAKSAHIPVIMLTAKGGELDRIKGLDMGADDYISKPFSVLEVISRIKAALRRYKDDTPNELKIGNILLCGDRRQVFVGHDEIALTFKEFELLRYLMINEGIVLSRDTLLEQVWGFEYIGENTSRTVDMHIKSLRKKLKSGGDHIKTVRSVGYKING